MVDGCVVEWGCVVDGGMVEWGAMVCGNAHAVDHLVFTEETLGDDSITESYKSKCSERSRYEDVINIAILLEVSFDVVFGQALSDSANIYLWACVWFLLRVGNFNITPTPFNLMSLFHHSLLIFIIAIFDETISL